MVALLGLGYFYIVREDYQRKTIFIPVVKNILNPWLVSKPYLAGHTQISFFPGNVSFVNEIIAEQQWKLSFK